MSQSFNQNINSDINDIKKWIVENFSTITAFGNEFHIYSSLYKYLKKVPLTQQSVDKIEQHLPNELKLKNYPIITRYPKINPNHANNLKHNVAIAEHRLNGDGWIEELKENCHKKYSEYGYTGDKK